MSVGSDEVPDAGCAGHIAVQPVLDVAIRCRRAFVLTKMFRPGVDEECLDEKIRLSYVAIDAPPERTITTPDAAVGVDRIEKIRDDSDRRVWKRLHEKVVSPGQSPKSFSAIGQ